LELIRSRVLAVALCGLALAGCAALGLGASATHRPAGPLGSTWGQYRLGTYVDADVALTDVAAQGNPNDAGSDIVLEYIRPSASTPGVTWLGVYVFDEAVGGHHHRPGFPPTGADMTLVPIEGHPVPAGADFSIAFGERVDATPRNGIQGLAIGYRIGDQHYETTLLYRSVLCAKPVGPACDADEPVPGLPNAPSD
jgi:hypothetical protein